MLSVGLHLWAWSARYWLQSKCHELWQIGNLKSAPVIMDCLAMAASFLFDQKCGEVWGGPIFRMKQSCVVFSRSLYDKFQCLEKLCYKVGTSQFLCILVRYWCLSGSFNLQRYRNSGNCVLMHKHSYPVSPFHQPYISLVALKERVNRDSVIFKFFFLFL